MSTSLESQHGAGAEGGSGANGGGAGGGSRHKICHCWLADALFHSATSLPSEFADRKTRSVGVPAVWMVTRPVSPTSTIVHCWLPVLVHTQSGTMSPQRLDSVVSSLNSTPELLVYR